MSIEKSVSKQEVNINDLIEYVIEITNNGPDSAENIKVSELLNPNLKVISFESTKGNFNNESNVLTIDELANSEKARLTINATAMSVVNLKIKLLYHLILLIMTNPIIMMGQVFL